MSSWGRDQRPQVPPPDPHPLPSSLLFREEIETIQEKQHSVHPTFNKRNVCPGYLPYSTLSSSQVLPGV